MQSQEQLATPARRQRRRHRAVKRTFYIDIQTDSQFTEWLANHGETHGRTNRSALVCKALVRYMRQEDNYWDVLFKTLVKLNNTIVEYTRGTDLLKNILMHKINYDFLVWPEFADDEKDSARERGADMAEKFEKSLLIRLDEGGYLAHLTPQAVKEILIENNKLLDLDELHAAVAEQKGQKETPSRPPQKQQQ